LIEFLDRDPRWRLLEAHDKWRAYERMTAGSTSENWTSQSFLPPRRSRMVQAKIALRRVARRAVRARQAAERSALRTYELVDVLDHRPVSHRLCCGLAGRLAPSRLRV
jgi:hypothetical protein